MGSSSRDHMTKVHLTENHALNSMRGMESPGPIYKPRTRVDEILDASERKAVRSWLFSPHATAHYGHSPTHMPHMQLLNVDHLTEEKTL